MDKIKLLFFVDRLGHGGIQTLLINILDKIDKEKFEISFLNFDFGKKYELEDLVTKQYGVKIYKVPHPQKHYFKCLKETKKFFKENQFDIIHCHSSSKMAIPLKYAKKYGVPVRIAHSHCTNFQTKNLLVLLMAKILMIPTNRKATHYFACSKVAGDWMFNHWYSKKLDIVIVNNAIDLLKYRYSKDEDKRLRERYQIAADEFVIGHVGRFMNQKNHEFLINAFEKTLKQRPNSKLVLVGIGDLKEKIEKLVEEKQLQDKVVFAGYQKEAYKFYSLFDIFVLPSLFEGLPFVGVEAQASGLPCLMADTITKDIVICNDNVKFLPLDLDLWSKEMSVISLNTNREDTYQKLKQKGYDISDEVKRLETLYEKYLKEGR